MSAVRDEVALGESRDQGRPLALSGRCLEPRIVVPRCGNPTLVWQCLIPAKPGKHQSAAQVSAKSPRRGAARRCAAAFGLVPRRCFNRMSVPGQFVSSAIDSLGSKRSSRSEPTACSHVHHLLQGAGFRRALLRFKDRAATADFLTGVRSRPFLQSRTTRGHDKQGMNPPKPCACACACRPQH